MIDRIKLLPYWIIPSHRPAFNDLESATVLEVTSKLYSAMRELQEDYNKFVDEYNKTITDFINDVNSDQEEFETKITKLVHDYIAMLDLKIAHQDKVIEDSIVYIKDNLLESVQSVINELQESGEFSEMILDSFDQLNTRLTNFNILNIRELGVMGDGTDETEKIQSAISLAASLSKKLYIPNGTYLISSTIVLPETFTDIEGESTNVIINKFDGSTITELFNFEGADHLRIKNITSQNLSFNLVPNEIYSQGFDVWSQYLKNKDYIFENLLYTGEGGSESYYKLICTPAPSDSERYADSKYARYPLRINSNSGYNAIEIENFGYNNTDDTCEPTDNSAIGIIDSVTNSTGVIFIDMKGDRSFERYVRGISKIQSKLKPGTVYEVSKDGHIAVGCSTDYNDEVAKSVSALKLRDNNPEIALFDASNDNRVCIFKVFTADDITQGLSIKVNGETAINLVYKWLNNTAVTGATNLRILQTNFDSNALKFYNTENFTEFLLNMDRSGRLRFGKETQLSERAIVQQVTAVSSANRPSLDNHWRVIGTMIFDTTLNKPLWWKGTSWVDSTGAEVSP